MHLILIKSNESDPIGTVIIQGKKDRVGRVTFIIQCRKVGFTHSRIGLTSTRLTISELCIAES